MALLGGIGRSRPIASFRAHLLLCRTIELSGVSAVIMWSLLCQGAAHETAGYPHPNGQRGGSVAAMGMPAAVSDAMKNRRRTTTKAKRPRAQKVRGRRNPSSTSASTKNTLLTRERDELLEQQQATAEVLRVISSSPGNLKPVFAVILENATRLCQANFGLLWLCEGNDYRAVAMHNAPPAFAEVRQREPLVSMSGTTVLAQVARTKRTIQVADIAKDPAYQKNPRNTQLFVKLAGARSVVTVPMLKDDNLIGAFNIYRQEVRPFTDKQIELVETFAAQAVIAIENTRLLNELRQSLEQQTATAKVLEVISSSPGELEPVFQTMLENAIHICEAKFGNLFLIDRDGCRWTAGAGTPQKLAEYFTQSTRFHPTPGSHLDRVMRTRQVSHTPDDTAEAVVGAAARLGGARSTVCVPMIKDDELVGAIFIYRTEVRPFTDKQIALVQNFAAQAVIAIENTRLLNELRQSLEQQTATADVLRVISSSPGELQPVFDKMLAKATELCEASYGALWLREGDAIRNVAFHGSLPEDFTDQWRTGSTTYLEQNFPAARAIRLGIPVHVVDMKEDPAYRTGHSLAVGSVDVAGIRTLVAVPMLKEGECVGAVAIYRREVRPFTEKQLALVQNFAAQAVIAIENTRLLNELRQSLEQQTATAEVLSVISSSPGELEPVFNAMLENAIRICEAKFGTLFRFDGEKFHLAAQFGTPAEFAEFQRQRGWFTPTPGSLLDGVMRTRRLSYTADNAAEPVPGEVTRLGGARSFVSVPMLKEGDLVGTINIYRQEVRPFTDKQIALVENFASQAVIAIENTRLLNELRQRTDDLTESLEQQTATSEVLSVISSSPGELEPVFQTMLESATRICAAKFGVLYLYEGTEFRPAALASPSPEFAAYVEERGAFVPHRSQPLGQLLQTKAVVHAFDDSAEGPGVASFKLGGARTFIAVPMLRENELVGSINIFRQEARPFTEKQIALVSNFAAQAVIAIENTRLLNELRQSLEQQTATAEVLSVISSSPGELEPVFQAMLANAMRICQAQFGHLLSYDGERFQPVATHGAPPAYIQLWQTGLQPGPNSGLGRTR